MTDKENTNTEEKSCTVCGIKSSERMLLHGEHQGKESWVCVRCLPALIHGGH